MKYKNIIFDFDGVLAESIHIKTQAFYSMYVRYGEEIADQVVIHHKENGGMSRYEKFPYYHKTFLDIDLSKKDVQILSADFSKLVIDSVVDTDEVSGALWFLKKYQNKYNYWIVSATPMDEINEIAKRRKISEYFVQIYGSPEKKSSILKNIINETGLKIDETVFLGDATSDYNAAKDNNIDFMFRQADENQSLFNNNNEIIRFHDFHELERILEGMN